MADLYDDTEKKDPILARIGWAVLWCVAYGIVWKYWVRPDDTWVNWVILAAIWISCLPPRRVRLFVSGIAEIGVAAVVLFAVANGLIALVLFVLGGINLVQGFRELSEP